MFGESKDSTTFNNEKYFCSDLLKEPGLCYYDFFEEYCCKTCPSLADSGSGKWHVLFRCITSIMFKTMNRLCLFI